MQPKTHLIPTENVLESGGLHEECAKSGGGPGLPDYRMELDPPVQSGGAGGYTGQIHAGTDQADVSYH